MTAPVHTTPEPLRTALAGLFATTAAGMANAVTLRRLMVRVDIGRYDERLVRQAIAELVICDGIPIAGDSRVGYYRAVTAEERLAQCRQLAGRIRALGRRMRVFAGRAGEETSGQMALDYSMHADEIAAESEWVEAVLAVLEGD